MNPQPRSTAIAGAFLWLFSTALFTFCERPIESPRLAGLASQVTKGDFKAVARFWTEVTENGTPLVVSVVELPKAPAQPWVAERPGVPKGQVQIHKVKSAVLGNERTVWVYTPAGYGKTTVPCGLLILFDGGAYTSWVPTPVILDNLIFEGHIPPLVTAFVGHPSLAVRNSELSCSLPFTRFLTAEFLPWLRRSYAVTEDPKLTVIGGSSNGGLGAAFAAFRHPEVFGNVLSPREICS